MFTRPYCAWLRPWLGLVGIALASAPAAAQGVRISQVYGAGGNVGAMYLNDYVELHNFTAAPVTMTNWSVQYTSASGTTWQATTINGTIPAGGYFLVQQSAGTSLALGQSIALPTPDAIGTITLSASDGKVALCNTTTLLSGAKPVSAALLDFVGIGATANGQEPLAGPNDPAHNAPGMGASRAIFRLNCGAADSDSNATDFSAGFPSPRNTATLPSAGVSGSGVALPYLVEPGFVTTLTATVLSCSTGDQLAGVGATLLADTSVLGGAAGTPMLDDGTGADAIAGDGVYTLAVTVGAAVASGSKSVRLSYAAGASTGGSCIPVYVTPASTPNNDNCTGAQAILGAPYTPPIDTPFNLTGANAESNSIQALTSGPTTGMGARRGLWYSVTGTGTTMTASLCPTVADTVILVMGGRCDGLTVVANGDDNGPACSGSSASASWCSILGETYYVWIATFVSSAPTLSGTLRVSADSLPCGTATPLGVCVPSLTATPEAESGFGYGTNDGCDLGTSVSAKFTNVTASYPPTLVRGTARGYGDTRDVDSFRFQAALTDTLTATMNGQWSGSVRIESLSAGGTCPATVLAASSSSARCGSTMVSAGVVAGNWYAVRVLPSPTPVQVGGLAPGGLTYHYELSLQLGGPPSNDNCANATTLSLGGPAVGGNTLFATQDGAASCAPIGDDIWYKAVLTSPGILRVDTCGSSIDTVLALFDACGGSELSCNDDCGGSPCSGGSSCLVQSGLSPGTYWIRVSDKGSGGTIQVKASFSLQNDDCSGAIAVSCGSLTSGTTSGANLESPAVPSNCTGPGLGTASGNFSLTAPGVWYSLTLPGVAGVDDRTVYADTATAGYDTKLSVYTGDCAALSCVTINDDSFTSLHSKVAWRATAGQPYFILVHGFSIATGSFSLAVDCQAPLANDDCISATSIGPNNGSLAGTTIGATGEPYNYTTTVMASCATTTSAGSSTFSYFDVWYSYTAPCAGTLQLDTCGSFDTLLSVHASCPDLNNPPGSFQLAGACNDQGALGCAPGSALTLSVASGATYLIRVAQASASTSGGVFQLSWSMPDADGDTVPDCADGCPLDPTKVVPGLCGCGNPETDSDGDGTPDCIDGCPLDPLKIVPGFCGCGSPETDSDGDGTPDCIDGCPLDPLKIVPGTCGCGNPETDSDGDGTPDCIDGCPLDPLKIAPGACGCGVPDVDSDGDGVLDCLDNCPTLPNPEQLDCDGNGVGDVCEIAGGLQLDCNVNGIPDNCEIDCNFNGVPDDCDIAAGTSFDLNLNTIPDECEATQGILFCFGDGSGTPCPCGNASLPGEGCANSTGRGAKLYNAGATSVSLDDALPQAIQLPPNKALIFIAGMGVQGGGNGVPFYDGLLCITVNKRFLGQTSSPTGTGAQPQPVLGSNNLIQPGSTWYFQAWFRDGASGPCGTKVNLSNGLEISFTP